MKTKKTKLIVLLALVAAFVLSMACFFTACGKEEEVVTHTIAWTIPDGTTVAVDGVEGLPESWAEGKEIVFTVTVPTGYTAGVKNGSTTVSANKDGKYSTKINKDTTIAITVSKTLSDIEVEVLKDVTYFEDNKVDVTSIKVTAKYVVGDEEVIDDGKYQISYTSGSAFSEGDTSYTVSYGGKSQIVTLKEGVKTAQDFGDATLEVDDDGNPVVVVTGSYNVSGDDKETAKAAVEAYAKECLERQSWASKGYTAEATIADDYSFVLRLTIKEWTATATGNHYYFRYAKNGVVADGQNLDCAVSKATCKPSDSNDDLSLTEYTGEPLEGKDGVSFYIGKCEDWGGCVMVVAVNLNAPVVKISTVAFEQEGEAAYAVFTGTSANVDQEALAAWYFDHEVTSVAALAFEVVSFDAETGAFVLKANITEFEVGTHWLHFGVTGASGNLGGTTVEEGKDTITVGDKVYTFAEASSCRQIIVAAA